MQQCVYVRVIGFVIRKKWQTTQLKRDFPLTGNSILYFFKAILIFNNNGVRVFSPFQDGLKFCKGHKVKERETRVKTFLICFLGLALSISFLSCAPLPVVKTDLKSLSEDPEKYQGKEVIITTDLKSLVENPAPYLGRKIELRGYVEYGLRRFGDWTFVLKDEEGRAITCYEREYRIRAWIIPTMAVRRAERNDEKITVVGMLQGDPRIELDWIEYDGEIIDTDYKPPRILITWPIYIPFCQN